MVTSNQYGLSRGLLIWTWVPRCIISLILLALAIRGYVVLNGLYNDYGYNSTGEDDVYLATSFGIIAGFTAGTIVLDLAEAVLFVMQKLHPITLLVSNVLKLIMWGFYLSLMIAAMIISSNFNATIFPVMLLFGFTLASHTYACVSVHRWRLARKQIANTSKQSGDSNSAQFA
ncbi:Hypothetical protein D9617_5g068140 [Elsinoe fawcettii]|nr:Hypothetical protein D9617_5g068140 [Elsinoe fawcettii]